MSEVDDFLKLLSGKKKIVALTGAGVSTMSGIPDFRSSDGLYSKKYGKLDVETIVSIEFFRLHPDVFYSWAIPYWFNMESYKPNIVHDTLKKMEDMGKLSLGIFTQNVDYLHERAGTKKVFPLHGTLERAYCANCHAFYSYQEISPIVRKGEVPKCRHCGSVIKPDIVFYGENLDMSLLQRAENAFSNADLVLVLGTSLIVNPAASLPYLSVQKGTDIVIVNKSDTWLDKYALMHFDDLEKFFSGVDSRI